MRAAQNAFRCNHRQRLMLGNKGQHRRNGGGVFADIDIRIVPALKGRELAAFFQNQAGRDFAGMLIICAVAGNGDNRITLKTPFYFFLSFSWYQLALNDMVNFGG